MEEAKIWKMVLLALCTFTATIASCTGVVNHQDNTAMIEMVIKGADPQDARCAVRSSQNVSECLIRAATKNR